MLPALPPMCAFPTQLKGNGNHCYAQELEDPQEVIRDLRFGLFLGWDTEFYRKWGGRCGIVILLAPYERDTRMSAFNSLREIREMLLSFYLCTRA